MSESNNTGHHVTPNGWIELREPRLVPEKLRRPIMSQMADMGKVAQQADDAVKAAELRAQLGEPGGVVGIDDELMQALYRYNDLIAVALVREWSFKGKPNPHDNGAWEFTGVAEDRFIPISMETLGTLPGEDYDAILKIVSPMAMELMPSFGVDPDPKATIGNSDESAGHSVEESPTQSTL